MATDVSDDDVIEVTLPTGDVVRLQDLGDDLEFTIPLAANDLVNLDPIPFSDGAELSKNATFLLANEESDSPSRANLEIKTSVSPITFTLGEPRDLGQRRSIRHRLERRQCGRLR